MQKGDKADDALSALQAPSFPGNDANEEIESSPPQRRWGKFTVTLGFGRGNIEEQSGEQLGYRERSALKRKGAPGLQKQHGVGFFG